MNISDLIKKLELIKEEQGDLCVSVRNDCSSWSDLDSICVEYEDSERYVKLDG